MTWYRIIAKATGERQHVSCDPAEVRRLYPVEHFFLPRLLDGEPGEADEFDLASGKMQRSEERRRKLDEEARWNRMSRAEMAEAIIAEAMRRMDQHAPAAAVTVRAGPPST